jgi:hypothetical protein
MPEKVGILEGVSDAEKTFALLAKVLKDTHDIHQHVHANVLDVDEFTVGTAPSTIWRPQRNYYKPIVIDYILAVYPITSTSVILTLGDRQIVISDPANGVFAIDCKMQLAYDDDRYMTLAPAGIGYLEIMGHVDEMQRDRT